MYSNEWAFGVVGADLATTGGLESTPWATEEGTGEGGVLGTRQGFRKSFELKRGKLSRIILWVRVRFMSEITRSIAAKMTIDWFPH